MPRLDSTNVKRFDERQYFNTKKRQEANDISQSLWRMSTTQMTYHFSYIHLPMQNRWYIAWSRQQKALLSIWTQNLLILDMLPNFVDQFIYLGSKTSFAKTTLINAQINHGLILTGYQPYGYLRSLIKVGTVSIQLYGCTIQTLMKLLEKSYMSITLECWVRLWINLESSNT